MSGNRKYWKLWARESLQGKWGMAILGMMAAPFMNTIGIMAANSLFPGTGFLAWLLGEAFLMIISLLSMIVSTGYNYMLLNMARGRSYGPGDLICMFRKGSDGVLTAGLVMALIDTLVMVPFYYLINMTEPSGGTAEALAAWMQPVMLSMLAGTAVGVLVKLPFSMTFYLLADDPQKKGIQALKESVGLMKGHILQFLVLQLSFVPMMILSFVTLYIGLLWIMPYMYASMTAFYMDVTGELAEKNRKHTQEMTHWIAETPDSVQNPYHEDRLPGISAQNDGEALPKKRTENDYDSEA